AMHILRTAFSVTLCLALAGGHAAAQPEPDDEPRPRASAPAHRIPDSTLQALRNRTVWVQQRGGAWLSGELLGYDSTSLTLALVTGGEGGEVGGAGVVAWRLGDGAAAGATAAPAASAIVGGPALVATAPSRERIFGLELGLAPAVMMDVEKGYFYGFV